MKRLTADRVNTALFSAYIAICSIFLLGYDGDGSFGFSSKQSSLIFGLLLILLLLHILAIWVQRRATEGGGDSSSIASMERALSGELETFRREINRRLDPLEGRMNSAIDEVNVIAERIVQERVNQEIGENVLEGIGKRILEQTSDYTKKENLKRDIIDAFNNSSTRIKAHAESAEDSARTFRRMGLTLAWSGIILAIVNLAIFYGEIYRGIAPAGAEPADTMALLRHLPFTLPFILLAEGLALIMFRYQSKGLEMMRYFSNEVTTLSLRQAGALATIEYGSAKAVADLATELLKSERNIILRKDEKTVELAQNRDEDSTLKALLAEIKGMAKREKAGAE